MLNLKYITIGQRLQRLLKRPVWIGSLSIWNLSTKMIGKVLPSDYDFEVHKEIVPMQAGDVPVTFADTTPLEQDFGFRPSTALKDGLRAFA